MQPLVGISTRVEDVDGTFGTLRTHLTPDLYVGAVLETGAAPVLLPVADPDHGHMEATVARLDGVVLTGGGDLHPSTHGRELDETVYGVDVQRDAFDLRLAQLAWQRCLPTLAICRGTQVVNVALGGQLVVDVPSEVGGEVVHRISERGVVGEHTVEVAPSSRLARQLSTTSVGVNSSHHQAIRTVGEGLQAVAWSDQDGVIEAVESTDASWDFLGVQWHPEVRPPDNEAARRPFEALVEAARRRREPHGRDGDAG
jgi:putative glutamine amidotransferase